MRSVLVFGASGAIGRFLLLRLASAGHAATAVSRWPQPTSPHVRWLTGDLERDDLRDVHAFDAIASCGPLDAFSRWFARTPLPGRPRVVAFGSLSIDSKRDSPDAAERALALRLGEAEQRLFAAADQRGCACTVLRPTLVYGAGIDRSLTPLARQAARWRVFPRLVGAQGLRQPVHADDLAGACAQLLAQDVAGARIHALGGGERLGFDAMLERVRQSLPVRCLPLPIPLSAMRLLAGLARAGGVAASAAAVARLRQDLVADDAPARAEFGWNPRPFRPDASTWGLVPRTLR
jgi:nucleoside-diphosphate-sugar epimerase